MERGERARERERERNKERKKKRKKRKKDRKAMPSSASLEDSRKRYLEQETRRSSLPPISPDYTPKTVYVSAGCIIRPGKLRPPAVRSLASILAPLGLDASGGGTPDGLDRFAGSGSGGSIPQQAAKMALGRTTLPKHLAGLSAGPPRPERLRGIDLPRRLPPGGGGWSPNSWRPQSGVRASGRTGLQVLAKRGF